MVPNLRRTRTMMRSELVFQKIPVKKSELGKPKKNEWKIQRRKQRKFKHSQRSIENYGR